MPRSKTPKTLLEAINAVMREVGYVEKAGEVTGFARYKYAGEAQFISAIRPWMVEYGLNLRCTDNELLDTRILTSINKRGEPVESVHQTWSFHYVMSHAPSGETIAISAVSNSLGRDDKGAFKAMTGAFKYAMRQTFMIETGDDPDRYQDTDDFSASKEVERRAVEQAKKDDRGRRIAALGSILKTARLLGYCEGVKLNKDNAPHVLQMVGEAHEQTFGALTEPSTEQLEQAAEHWRKQRPEGQE